MKKILAGLAAVASVSSAFASTYTGPVLAIRSAASEITSNTVRFSVHISGSTACTNSGWYSAEFPDASGTGKVRIATLLAAQARGSNVTIAGTGACDSYYIEKIYYIDGLP
jgi:hypothetical protein